MITKKIEYLLKEGTCEMFNDKWYNEMSFKIEQLISEDTKGYVYFIKSTHTGFFKIGMAKNIINRLETLKRNNGEILLCGFIFMDDYKKKESELHLKFKENNIYGEWFNLNLNIVKDVLDIEKGVFVNLKFTNNIIIENGDFSEKILQKQNDMISLSIYKFIAEKIELNTNYDIKEVYNNFDKNILSQKKLTMTIQNYCKDYGLKYKGTRTHNSRLFSINF
jgi:hypothetical protein